MENSWCMDIEYNIFTIVKARSEKKVKDSFPNVVYTNDNESNTPTTNQHTIYIHLIDSQAVGNDLEGKSINAVLVSFEVIVTSATTKSDCIKIMRTMIDEFMGIGFNAIELPAPQKNESMYTAGARFRRVIGYGDKI